MNIEHIIKRAWELTSKHKFLWIFGLFAGGLSFPSQIFQYTLPAGDPATAPDAIQTAPEAGAQALGLVSRVFATHDLNIDYPSPWLIAGAVLGALAFIYLSTSLMASLIWSVDELDQKKKTDFWKSWAMGRRHVWRVLLLGLYFAVLAVGALLVIGVPVFLLVSVDRLVLAITLGILGGLLFLAWCFFLSVVAELANRIVILEDHSVSRSVTDAFNLVKRKLGSVALLWLVHAGLSIAIGIGTLVVMLLIMGILALIGGWTFGFSFGLSGFDSIPPDQMLTFGVVAALVALLPLLILSGWVGSFLSAFWTLGYRQLK